MQISMILLTKPIYKPYNLFTFREKWWTLEEVSYV